MREIVAVQDLKLGMFVAELDRPWLGTPFAIQGFLVEDEEHLAQLRRFCRFVYIDRSRSAGEHWREPAQPQPRMRRRPTLARAGSVGPTVAIHREAMMPDFFTILRLLREGSARNTTARNAPIDTTASHAGASSVPGHVPRIETARYPYEAITDDVEPNTPTVGGGGLFARLAGLFRWDPSEERTAPSGMKSLVATEEPPQVYPVLTSVEEELITVAPVFHEASVAVEKLLHDIQVSATPDLKQVTATVSTLVQSVVRNPDALIWLTRLKRTDQYAFDHALDVSVYLVVFGRFLGLPEATLEMLGTVGLMQDVGLVNLPPDLLHKPGRFTPAEMKVFAGHVQHSVRIMRDRCNLSEEIIETVSRHHERVNGKGYPHGLQGDEIGIYGEMAGLVDSYCALLSQRPYRTALTSQRALEKIYGWRNKKFSETVIDQFIQCLGLYPIGTLVELESGEVAVVIGQNRVRRLKPKLMVLLGPDKTPLKYPSTIDLLFDPPSPTGAPHAIRQALPSDAYGIDPREYFLA